MISVTLKSIDIESIPPNREMQTSFLLVYSSCSIFHQQLFYISVQEKKSHSIEKELIHLFYFILFLLVIVLSSLIKDMFIFYSTFL